MPFSDSNLNLSQQSDSCLCSMVANNSNAAFEEITRRYQGLIYVIAKDFSYPGFDSNDFFQLGLMGLYSACKTYNANGKVSFKNYAALCIKRRYTSLVRSLLSKKSVPADAVVSVDESDSDIQNPEYLLLNRENDEEFFKSVRVKLSYMEFAVMKEYVTGKTYKEIAEKLGLSFKAVDNALVRIRKKLSG